MNRILANGLNFAFIEEGSGPLVILLHGFPDTAHSWDYQIRALAAAGYHAVAPYLRGYAPTEIPPNGFYDKATLATDAAALIRALGGGKPVHLVGQDWGAIIAYAVLAAFPELVRRAVVMAIPHPAQAARFTLEGKHIQRSFHWWFFQMADLPEQAIAANDFALIDYLWSYWSAPGFQDAAHLAEIKAMLREPGVIAATLGYYRALFDPHRGDPRLEPTRLAMTRPIKVPTLALCGDNDLRAELMVDQAHHFFGEYDYQVVAGAGHFLHREKPEEVTRLMLRWLGPPA